MNKNFHRRTQFVCLILVVGLTVLSWRLINLQQLNPMRTTRGTPVNYEIKENLPASRGLILDRNETPLAQNRPEATLIVDKTHLAHRDNTLWGVVYHRLLKDPEWLAMNEKDQNIARKALWRTLSKKLTKEQIYDEHLSYACEVIGGALRVKPDEIEKKVRGKGMEIIVKKDIRDDDAKRLDEEMERCRIQGFRFKHYYSRAYSAGTLAPHLVGFVDAAGDGQMGIERNMEKYLRGASGYRVRKKNKDGLLISSENAEIVPPIPGLHVKLTLDVGVQGIVEEELDAALKTYDCKKGTIIIMDPANGDILAMANRPHFDLNRRENVENAWTNFAVQGSYEPGSIFKIVATSAALDTGVASPRTVVDCGWGEIKRDGYRVPDHHNYGELTLAQVLAKSSNTGTFLFAERVGKRRYYDYLNRFGFGHKTGFPVAGEVAGTVNDGHRDVDFSRVAYGYAVSVTPLQIACAYSVIANGGLLMKPRLISEVIADDGSIVEKRPPEEVRRAISERTAQQMREALQGVVTSYGTGSRAAVPGFYVAGKTGTAWKYIPEEKRYDPKRKALTFAGMLPADAPAFVCVVMLDEPTLGADELSPSGGSVPAPIFAKVAARVAAQLNLKPTRPIEPKEILAQH